MTMLTRAALRWMEEQRQRAVLRRLLDHDDRTLEDIGLTRIETEIALNLPPNRNAMAAARAGSAKVLHLDKRGPEPAHALPEAPRRPVRGTRAPAWFLRLWRGVSRAT